MARNRDIGKKGEHEAEHFLLEKGFRILDRNFRFKRCEIDLIVIKEELLVFVEVKVRSSNTFGYPESFVSNQQVERITEAAEEYQHQIGWSKDIRFDIISIEGRGEQSKITHFEDAFY